MNKKIYNYLFILKIKYIFINIFFIGLFVQLINLLEISRIVEDKNSDFLSIIYLSLLKIPSTISDTIPFVVVVSTAFLFRTLITNNELISLRNVGFSIIDVFKPIGLAIFFIGILIIFVINPMAASFEKTFDKITTKDFSDLYSIKIKNDELWIRNIKSDDDKYLINISNIDLDKMEAEDIKIISISKYKDFYYSAKNGKIENKKFNLSDVIIFDIDQDKYQKKDKLEIDINFNNRNLIDSISNFKFVPFYKYFEHINSLKKFNLYSPEIALYYLSEIVKPLFLVIVGFTVMGFSGKFKRNENFFKILFISILIGFLLFLLKEVITALTISFNLSFWLAYLIILIIPLLIGLYQTIIIEKN
tara:strand:+ start:332 stop:1414 length:1083 start_codon:yes stop_codon:yes gene_type:complete